MDQYRHDAPAFGIAEAILLGTHQAFDHRVDSFEMARIGGKRNGDVTAVDLADGGRAKVVFDVARTLGAGRIDVAFEFGEDLFQVLPDRVGKDVEASAVRHPHHHFSDIVGGGTMQNLFQDGERGLPAFEGEALLAHKAGMQEVLKLFGGDEIPQGAHTGVGIEFPLVGLGLHTLLQPALLLGHLDVHVLGANFAAVGFAQSLQNFAQRGDRFVAAFAMLPKCPGEELAIEIPDGKPVGFGLQLGVELRLRPERVEIGDEVAPHAEGIDHLHDGRLLGDFRVARSGHPRHQGLAIHLPMYRLMRHFEVLENLFVETVVAVEQILHLAEEGARFRALDDAVVVRATQRHHLADAEDGAGFGRGSAILGRIVDGA